jgi:hypothetical protein
MLKTNLLMSIKIKGSTLLVILMLFSTSSLLAQNNIQTERVHFKTGESSAFIEGQIKGYQIRDYILNVKEGQYINVSMATKNGANYFNILEPGETEVAMFNGSLGENQYEGITSKSGDYKIRVYMMRSAARRNEVAKYRLEVIVTNVEKKSQIQDAFVPGTNYHATGNIQCFFNEEKSATSCPFGVVREGNGSGTVTITKPDGRTRTILFENGKATGYDQSEADKGKFSSKKKGDLYIIYIGNERYEIPEAVIFGG